MAFIFFAVCGVVRAQWEIENSGTTADLRGIDNVGGGVAWASGTNGTVLRTEDGGYLWQLCAVPPGAEHLDFRGIQAFDANTAIVMSSGKGDLSRLYKTTDGCHTWKLVFTNPDKDGFWDAVKLVPPSSGVREATGWRGIVIGDPVDGQMSLFTTNSEGGENWSKIHDEIGLKSNPNEAIFAASNSSLIVLGGSTIFTSGGPSGARVFLECPTCDIGMFIARAVPLPKGESAGVFSIAGREAQVLVAVGGDYTKPDDSTATAAWSDDDWTWHAAHTPPQGYRSAVDYEAATKTWITVGPNGTDISTDDGKNWRALHPNPALHEAPDADRNWNALSLPFVVGPHGRIGKLRSDALNAVGK
ncbi:MAG: hypothetical protein ABSD59_00480 [Terracidiphilus sp.]|jgi:photosystem II stability/assembly factor-like uncharacterized protein